jgi:hypothetical protein
MTTTNKTRRTLGRKDLQMEIRGDFQQIKDQEMHCYLASAKTLVSDPNIKNRIDKQMSDLRKKIEGR